MLPRWPDLLVAASVRGAPILAGSIGVARGPALGAKQNVRDLAFIATGLDARQRFDKKNILRSPHE